MSWGSRAALRPEYVRAALVSTAAAVLLGRSGLGGQLTRDESVYAYAGQQLWHGVAPYASIFDPKGPVAAMIAAVGAGLGSVTGHSELAGIRVVYGVIACLGVGATCLLAERMWGSGLAGLSAGVALCCFPTFAADSFSGPDAKTPVVLFLSLTMWLALRGNWFLAGLVGGVATLTWQPLVVLPVLVLLCAWFGVVDRERVDRVRAARAALTGLGLALLACLVFFVVTGTVGLAFDATVRFPLEGIKHGQTSALARLAALRKSVFAENGTRGVLWCVGAFAFLVLAGRQVVGRSHGWRAWLREPLTLMVVAPALALAGYCLVDFQGGPDLLPLLPFAAMGIGGLVARLTSHFAEPFDVRGRVLLSVVALLALMIGALVLPRGVQGGLTCQRMVAHDLSIAAGGRTTMWAFGDPAPLVLAQRRNPDRFVYLASGVAAWKVRRTPGGLGGWESQIHLRDPDVVVFGGYHEGDIYRSLVSYFNKAGYRSQRLREWRVYLAPGVRVPSGLSGQCR